MTASTDEELDAYAPAPHARRRGLLGRAAGWVQADHLRRGPHLLAPLAVGAAALAHTLEAPALLGVPLTGLATLGMYARAMNRPGEPGDPARAAAATALSGAWLTAAAHFGPTAGPYGLMGWLAAATYGITYWAYRKTPAIREALAWQQACTDWHAKAPAYGLAGSHLVGRSETRLGERYEISTVGTGKRASALIGAALEERIAELESLPASRVKTRRGAIAGRLTISIRYKNPWAQALPHPLLDDAPEIPLPAVADVREPLIIGMDPETGRPLEVAMWDEEEGANRILIVATSGGGKTVVVSDLLERLTAADNAFTVGINVSKAKEMRRWRRSLGLSACGPDERVKALRILETVRRIIDWRGQQDSDDATVIPRRSRPMVVVVVDEANELLAGSDQIGMALRREFAYLMSKGRSEGVGAIVAGQRGTVTHLGSGDIKRMFNQAILLKTNGDGEVRHVLGEIGVAAPSMMTYGEGHPGVALVSDLAGSWMAGRSWKLRDLPDLDRLAAGRAACPLEPELVEHLGGKLTAVTGVDEPAPRRTRHSSPPPIAPPEPAMPADGPTDRAAQQRAAARATLAGIEVPTVEGLTPGQARAAAIERRRQAAEQTEMTPEIRQVLLRLISSPEGTTTRTAEHAMREELGYEVGVSKSGAWRCLDVLRFEGVAELRGKGRGARWHLVAPPEEPEPEDVGAEEAADPVFEHELRVEEAEDAATEDAADTLGEHGE